MAIAEALHVEIRDSRGKQAAKQMRRDGRIPGVVYAAGQESVPVSVDAHDFATITRNHGLSALVKLDGLPGGETIAVYKQLQLHPVRYETQHIDFQAIPAGAKVTIKVRVLIEGLPVGVDKEGGVLVKVHDTVTVEALPGDLPEFLKANVAHLHRGESLHASDVALPEGVRLVSDPKVTLANVSGTRASLAKAKAEEGGEGEAAKPAAAPAKKK